MKLVFKPWESTTLKLKVFSLKPQQISRLAVINLKRLPHPCLVSVRVKEDAVKQIEGLKKLGFYLIENYQVYESPTSRQKRNSGVAVTIKTIGPESAAACRQLAKKSFHYDRFHRDPNIKKNLADLSRASWIGNALNGKALFVLGAFFNKKLVGFIDINKKGKAAIIDLIAVDVRYRRKDIASQLIEAAKSQLAKLHLPRVQVGTQAENLPSISCYKKNNFKLIASYKTFHYYKS